MTQSTRTLFVGIDAHQNSLAIAVLPQEAAAPEPVRVIANEPVRIGVFFRELLKRAAIESVYEAGCLGFVLQRQLESLGVRCVVAAPSRIPVLPGERRKTDRLDAQRLAIFLRGGQLTAVRPPSPELEALRSLVRTRQALQDDVVRARHRLQKFLLARGHIWNSGANWSARHLAWIHTLKLSLEEDRSTRDFLELELHLRLRSIQSLDERIAQRAECADVRDPVLALEAFRGVGALRALNVIAEIGDPRRFSSAEQAAAYTGMIPSEHSSGEKVRRGSITRSGNGRLRRVLIETSQHYARARAARSRALEARRAKAPREIAELARFADQRLIARYRALHHRKHTNVVKTAIARELVGFLWRALLLTEKAVMAN